MNRDRLYLSNIVECIGQIEQYVVSEDYLRVDVAEVWVVVEQDLPVLKPRLVELLEEVNDPM